MVGVKESCGDLDQISEVIARCPEDFAVLSGDDALTLPLLAIGGKGVISHHRERGAVRDGGAACARSAPATSTTARRCHYRLLPLFQALFCETNPIPVKAALQLMGAIGPRSGCRSRRSPSRTASGSQVVLKELGLARMSGRDGVRRVLVVGALGRMGECVRAALAREPALVLARGARGEGPPAAGRDSSSTACA